MARSERGTPLSLVAEPEPLGPETGGAAPNAVPLSVVPVIMGGVPLPESPGEARTLIGRENELDELASTIGVRAGAVPQRAVLLSGDAGVG